ncbi:TldD/PmbA family protein [candidate division CSSED10-310 bacterium]|uniref:TldD/PmbA family protein n=1 Tax=candidate division CSSED10-310 bacterium TaxID=2855610 RepID=A0ABV6Z4U8_UNCC1
MKLEDQIAKVPFPCELFQLQVESLDVIFQNEKLKSIDLREYNSQACRVIKDNCLGFTTGSGQTPFEVLYTSASEGAEFGQEAHFNFITGPGEKEESTALDPQIEALTEDELIERGATFLKRLQKEKPAYNNHAGLGRQRETIRIISNQGIDRTFTRNSFSMGFGLTKTTEGDIIEFGQGFNHIPSTQETEEALQKTINNLALCEKVVTIEGGKYPVLIHPVAFTFLWEPLYEAINAKAVYEKISPLKDKIGQKIFSDKITLVDDPTWVAGDNYTQFDDEGVPATRKTIVDQGVLTSFLTNLDYAARLNIEPTGNGFRKNWLTNKREADKTPAILPTNRIIQPGTTDWKDLMASIKVGVLLWFTADCWLGNLINGDFSGTIDLGYKIVDGEPVGRIKDSRVSGNIYSLFNEQVAGVSSYRDFSYHGFDQFPYILCQDVPIS